MGDDHRYADVGAADLLAEFSISETGGIDGAPGDQAGRESRVHGYFPVAGTGYYTTMARRTGAVRLPTLPLMASTIWHGA